ncbi:MAG: hypothetical protein GXO12_07025 [Epsilonproteobacteria bacterium]|nr:hypothetical protein [Campylobacterota bacterium]
MTMTISNIKKQLLIYISLDILLIAFSLYKGLDFLLNSQVAFLTSLMVTMLSFLSYLKNINKQIGLLSGLIDDRDYIDELDDPYELYSGDEKKDKISKAKITMKNLSKSKSAAFSVYRIVGYIILIAGFMMLVKFDIFAILPYILGISIVPLGTLLGAIIKP